MPQLRFTENKVKKLPAPGHEDGPQVVYRDPRYPGLLLKVGRNKKTWAYRAPSRTLGGRRPWVRIGHHPKVSFKQALARYKEEDIRLKNGQPPEDLMDRIKDLEAELSALKRQANLLTFEALVDEYHRRRLLKLKNPGHNLRILKKDPVRVWAGRPADEIRREDVLKLLDEVEARAPILANRLLAIIKSLYNWAIKAQLLRANPAAGIDPPVVEHERDRYLDTREIRLYWWAWREKIRRTEVADALCLCLITGQRRVEVAGMTWNELAWDDKGRLWWLVPAERKKENRSNRVYLPPLAAALVHRQREAARVSKTYVFPRQTTLAKPIREDELSTAMRLVTDDLLARRLIGRRAKPHDLRRTATTHWAMIGIDRRYQKLMLNHGSREVTDIYDRYQYDDELVDAWGRWARHLTRLLRVGPGPSR